MTHCEGSTPLHPDDQLDRLADAFAESGLYWRGVLFIQFARSPIRYGYAHIYQQPRIIHDKEREDAKL